MRYLPPMLVFLFVILSMRCAHQVRPEGGPPDKTPPKIIKVTPENGSTLVPRDQMVEFEFSEGMNRNGFEKAIFITPNPGEAVRFKWKGSRLRIAFEDSLLVDRTYVITLGTDLKDAHNNALQASYTLAFSTGSFISSGEISGLVYYKQTRGILMWAYILNDEQDPDPSFEDSDYVTQTDDRGNYALKNLSAGTYRIFAIQDTDNNRFFEKGIDAIGVPVRDIVLETDSTRVEGFNFRLTLVDTIGPALTSATATDREHVALRFDEELQEEGAAFPGNFDIQALGGKDSLIITNAILNKTDQTEILLTTSRQAAKTDYRLRASGLRDKSGNLLDPNYDNLEFSSSAVPDTIRPRILMASPSDKSKTVLLTDSIRVQFDEPMDTQSLEQTFRLLDSTNTLVEGSFQWEDASTFLFVPAQDLLSAADYNIRAKLDSVNDRNGNAVARDSLWTLGFRTVDRDTFAAILGTIADADSQATGDIFLSARQGKKEGIVYRLELAQPGPYHFENILPGTYVIEGFRDADGNDRYTFGETKPFVAAERFFVYPDSIKVRSRWPNEGNDIVLE